MLLSTKTTTISRIQQDSEQDNTRFIVKKKIEHKTGRKLSWVKNLEHNIYICVINEYTNFCGGGSTE